PPMCSRPRTAPRSASRPLHISRSRPSCRHLSCPRPCSRVHHRRVFAMEGPAVEAREQATAARQNQGPSTKRNAPSHRHLASPSAVLGTSLPRGADGSRHVCGCQGWSEVSTLHVFAGKTVVGICSHHLRTEPVPRSERLGVPLPECLGVPLPECLEELVLACLARTGAIARAAPVCSASFSWRGRGCLERRGGAGLVG